MNCFRINKYSNFTVSERPQSAIKILWKSDIKLRDHQS